jgi:hypothetical protein
MDTLRRWPDEAAFHSDDARRRTSAEVDLGATWRSTGSNDAWRVAWLRETGELYVCRADGHDGSCTDVSVLAEVDSESALDDMLEGWRDHRDAPDGLDWVVGRLRPLAVA